MRDRETQVLRGFEYAKEVYGALGVDVEQAIARADAIPVSMHSWQGDDLIGFDGIGELTGGISATGNYPGRARTADELRADIDKVLTLIPGTTRISLHACHAELDGKKLERDAYTPEQFRNWMDWAKERKLSLDFNPTFFSYHKMDGDFSLASQDKGTRDFWIEHGKRCREIGAAFGEAQGNASVVNFWMPDGYKDIPADPVAPRMRMMESLDEIFRHPVSGLEDDTIESKLFGLGIESYTVVSHEFAFAYAMSRKKAYCLDAGHFHPTERISEKIVPSLMFLDKVLLHLSRGVRWDSDHVVIWDDELQNIMNTILHNKLEDRVYCGQDYFDASINRIACWAIAMRSTRKAMLKAALDPIEAIRQAEYRGDYTARLALLEESKSLPFAAVWDYYCLKSGKPVGESWLDEVKKYEREVLLNRW